MNDSNGDNPFIAMAELWTQGAKAYTQSMQSFIDAANDVAKGGHADGVDPVKAAQTTAKQWAEAVTKLSALGPQMLESLFKDLPRTVGDRIDAQTFSQMGRMAEARWEEDIRRLSEIPVELTEHFAATDMERVARLLSSMSAEYIRDLEQVGGMATKLNVEPIVNAFMQLANGKSDERSVKIVDRLLKSTVTKLKYGTEYFADPEETEVGQSPRVAVHEIGKATLYRYTPPEDSGERKGDPLLLVYSIINRPYILDLVPGYSFVEHLLSQGLDVYLIDWGETEPGDRTTTLDSYVDPVIRSCVGAIKDRTGAERVSLFGHCIGGNMALLYASLYPEDVARVLTLTTPITAGEGGVVALWTDRDLFPVDTVVETFGHMPAKLIRYTFIALKPYYEVLKWKMYIENIHDDAVIDFFHVVDRWANDNVDLPGEVFRKFVVEVFHEDRFRRGETRINGRVADIGAVTCPVYNLAASKDWIVPPASTSVLADSVGSDENFYTLIDGSHVAIMIEPRLRHHWTDMSDFMLGRAPTNVSDPHRGDADA